MVLSPNKKYVISCDPACGSTGWDATCPEGVVYIMSHDGKTWTYERDGNSTGIGRYWDPLLKNKNVADFVTKKDLKIMKAEVKKYMTEQMKKDAKEIAGQLFKDVEKLKKEKTTLKKDMTLIKKQLKQIKKDIEKAMSDFEETIDKQVNRVIRFDNLDL